MLEWKPEPHASSDGVEMIAVSGDVAVGGLRVSASGRWRWEVVPLPGLFVFRDDHFGWVNSEEEAREVVQKHWNDWLKMAGLQVSA